MDIPAGSANAIYWTQSSLGLRSITPTVASVGTLITLTGTGFGFRLRVVIWQESNQSRPLQMFPFESHRQLIVRLDQMLGIHALLDTGPESSLQRRRHKQKKRWSSSKPKHQSACSQISTMPDVNGIDELRRFAANTLRETPIAPK